MGSTYIRRRGNLNSLSGKWKGVWLVFTICALALLAYSPSRANDDNHVAVVVDFGDGRLVTRCVGFSEDSISGFEALTRTGLPVETDFQTGGAAVCRVDGQGCPSEDCFCSCRGGDCKYWSYWHLKNGAWNYSAAGSGIYTLHDGEVDGWVWGLGSVTQASPPPIIPFGEICVNEAANSPTPTATIVQQPTSTPMILPTQPPIIDPQPATIAPQVTSTSLPVVTPTNDPTVQPADAIPALPDGPAAGVTATAIGQATPEEGERIVAQPSVNGLESSSATDYSSESGLSSAPLGETQPLETSEIMFPELSEPTRIPIETGITFDPVAVGPDESEPVDVVETRTMTIAAVVGEGADLAMGQSASSVATSESSTNGTAYLGFVGMILFLAALGLLTYRRRAMQAGEREW